MLQNDTNRSLAGQVQANNTKLFGGLTAVNKVNTATPAMTSSAAFITEAAQVKMAKPSSIHQPAIMASRTSQPVMAMGTPMKPNTSAFFGQPAETVRVPTMQQATPAIQRTTNINMFAGSSVNQVQKSSYQPASFIDSIGQQVSIGKQMPTVQSSSRASAVVMEATATASAGTDSKTDAAYMDKVFLQQKYDNSDHLDPDLHYTGNQYIQELMKNAKLLSSSGKGILASDESNGTCGKRFEALGVENTEKNRNDYREMLYTAPGLSEHVSGCIMYDETIRQKAKDGRTLVKVLSDQGILSGIKVDTGITIIEGTNDETVTNGLDGLS